MAGQAKLEGPLYKDGGGLGSEKVGGPTGGKSTPDPLKLNKTSGGK